MNTYTIAAIVLFVFIIIYSYRKPLGEAVTMAKLINEGKKEQPDLNKAIDEMLKTFEDKDDEQ